MSSEPVPRRATVGLLLGTYGAILVGVGATVAPWYVNQYEFPVQARWETLGTYTLRQLGPTGLANALARARRTSCWAPRWPCSSSPSCSSSAGDGAPCGG